MEKAQYSSAADIEKMQFEKLKSVLIHAYEYVPYYHKIFDEYIKKMDSFGVEFLHGFPSAIYSLCEYAKQLNIDLKNKYKAVFLISENIYDFQKSMIKEILGCDTFAFYGHTERTVFAEQIGGGIDLIPFMAVFKLIGTAA